LPITRLLRQTESLTCTGEAFLYVLGAEERGVAHGENRRLRERIAGSVRHPDGISAERGPALGLVRPVECEGQPREEACSKGTVIGGDGPQRLLEQGDEVLVDRARRVARGAAERHRHGLPAAEHRAPQLLASTGAPGGLHGPEEASLGGV